MARGSNSMNNPAFLEAALEGLELQKARLEDQIAEVRRLLGRRGGVSSTPAEEAAPANGIRRQLSPEARKRIAAAQKRRWAAYRKAAKGSGKVKSTSSRTVRPSHKAAAVATGLKAAEQATFGR